MDTLEKREYYIYLFDFYGAILTPKQREYFTEYYFNDLSLSEISVLYNVSRNAVFDTIHKIHKILEKYEENLNLYKKFLQRNSLYEEYSNNQNEEIKKLIENLKEIE